MKKLRHILNFTVMLLLALPAVSCRQSTPEEDTAELSVSIYIPDLVATKAETGSVGAIASEKVFSSLQLWVFLHGGANDGQLVGYKGFTAAQLTDTGLPHSAFRRLRWPFPPPGSPCPECSRRHRSQEAIPSSTSPRSTLPGRFPKSVSSSASRARPLRARD